MVANWISNGQQIVYCDAVCGRESVVGASEIALRPSLRVRTRSESQQVPVTFWILDTRQLCGNRLTHISRHPH